MKLLSINNSYAFHGLWGKTNVEFIGNDYSYAINHTSDYHPFKDETASEIDTQTGRLHNRPSIYNEAEGTYLSGRDFVNVRERLAFTRDEYNKYKQKLLSKDSQTNVIEKIENELKFLKLNFYLNDYVPQNFISKFKSVLKKLF